VAHVAEAEGIRRSKMDYAAFHALEVRVRQLEETVAKLQGLEPPKPREEVKYEPVRFDPLANAVMPPSVMAAMTAVDCGDPRDAARALAMSRQPSMAGGTGQGPPVVVHQGTQGWVDPRELPSFGKSAADRMVDDDLKRRK
jgi:hypothetical protein